MAFFGFLDAGGSGIFTGPDPLADAVVQIGEVLFGASITEISFGSLGLNDKGQITFWASLSDGTQAIFRADPLVTAIPEPGSLVLLGIGLLSLFLARRSPLSMRDLLAKYGFSTDEEKEPEKAS